MKIEKIIAKIIAEINRENRGDNRYYGMMQRGELRAYCSPYAMLSWHEDTLVHPDTGILTDPVTGVVTQPRCPDLSSVLAKCDTKPMLLTPALDWLEDAATRSPLPRPNGDEVVFFDGQNPGRLVVSELQHDRPIRLSTHTVANFPARPCGLQARFLRWIWALAQNDKAVEVRLYADMAQRLSPNGVQCERWALTIMPYEVAR